MKEKIFLHFLFLSHDVIQRITPIFIIEYSKALKNITQSKVSVLFEP